MAELPRLITLMLLQTFFEYEINEGELHATLRHTSTRLISENNFTLFEVEKSSRVRGMVHIKSCFNNRYLRLNPTGLLITATADELEEDQAKRSCTLFRFFIFGDTVRFVLQSDNVQWGVMVHHRDRTLIVREVPHSDSARPESYAFGLGFFDMTNFVNLPTHVMFKADNGNYLRARPDRNLEFFANNPRDPTVHHIATIATRTGDFSLLSTRFNLHWVRISGDWLQANSRIVARGTIFRPVRQGFGSQANTIALLNTDNNRYCQRWTSGRDARRIRASSATVPPTAVLTVEEAVRDREITDIRYRTNDARIHDMVPIQSISQTVFNFGNHDERQKVGFTYREVIREKFTSSHSWKLSVRTTIRVRLIPILVQGQLTMSASYAGSVEWAKERITERTANGSTTATVPARSSTRVTLIVGQGSMDVPYSYTQNDILMDGSVERRTLHDGLFSGLNTYEFQYIIDPPQPLPRSARSPTGHDDIVIVPGESRDLPRTAISSVFDEVNVEGKEEEPLPLPKPSKL